MPVRRRLRHAAVDEHERWRPPRGGGACRGASAPPAARRRGGARGAVVVGSSVGSPRKAVGRAPASATRATALPRTRSHRCARRAPRDDDHPGHAAADVGRATIDVASEPTGRPSAAAWRSAVRDVRARPSSMRSDGVDRGEPLVGAVAVHQDRAVAGLEEVAHLAGERDDRLARLLRVPAADASGPRTPGRRSRRGSAASASRRRSRRPRGRATTPAPRRAPPGGGPVRIRPAARRPPPAPGRSTRTPSAPPSRTSASAAGPRGSGRAR